MNKKGDMNLQTMTIVAGVISAIMLLLILSRVSSSHAINVNFIAKDSALLIDTIQASPQNVRVLYSSEFLANSKPNFFGKEFLILKQKYIGIEPTNDNEYSNLKYYSNQAGLTDIKEDAGSYFTKYYFIPSGFFSPVVSSVSQATFFIVKEGNIYFVSSTPEAIKYEEVAGSAP